MASEYCTLGVWRVKEGNEAEFIAAWKAVGEAFYELPHPPGPGTLLRSESDPSLFHSFGPWDRLEDIQAMRDDPRARAAAVVALRLAEEGLLDLDRPLARYSEWADFCRDFSEQPSIFAPRTRP